MVKIDLENISSGDGSDFSGDSSSPSPTSHKLSTRDDALEMEFASKTSAVPSESPNPTKKARKSRKDRMGKAQESVTYSQNDSEIDKIRIGQSIHHSYNKQRKVGNAIPSVVKPLDLKIQVNQLNLKDLQAGIKSPLSIAGTSQKASSKNRDGTKREKMSSEDLQRYDQLDEMGKLEKPAKTYEKLRLQFKNKQLQYSLLLDKYERSTKKIMQLQDVIRDHRLSDLKLKYKSQIEMMECQRKED